MKLFRVRTLSVAMMLCIMMLSAGCAYLPWRANPEPVQLDEPEEVNKLANVGKMDYLAAINLVNTIVQVPRLHPGTLSVVQMHKPERRFGRYVSEVMSAAGYAIEYVDRWDDEAAYLTYSRALGPVMSSYKIGIGEFKIRRSYTVEEDLVLPASSIYVFGADPDVLSVNDDIFDQYDVTARAFSVAVDK